MIDEKSHLWPAWGNVDPDYVGDSRLLIDHDAQAEDGHYAQGLQKSLLIDSL